MKQILYLTPTKLVNYIEKHKLINYFMCNIFTFIERVLFVKLAYRVNN